MLRNTFSIQLNSRSIHDGCSPLSSVGCSATGSIVAFGVGVAITVRAAAGSSVVRSSVNVSKGVPEQHYDKYYRRS